MRLLMVAGLVCLAFCLAWMVDVGWAGGGDLTEGAPAPAVELQATQIGLVLPEKKDAKTLNLQDFKGKKNVVLFFFPKAMTKGWTIESCGFRDRIEQFAQLDTVVIGASADTLELQKKFTEKEKLNYPLLADPERKAIKAYGVLGSSGLASRATFVIDKEGKLAKIYTKVTPATHPDEVAEFIKTNLVKKK